MHTRHLDYKDYVCAEALIFGVGKLTDVLYASFGGGIGEEGKTLPFEGNTLYLNEAFFVSSVTHISKRELPNFTSLFISASGEKSPERGRNSPQQALGICESILMSIAPFSVFFTTETKSYGVFLEGFSDFSRYTVQPGIRSSLHLPVFFT